MTRFSGTSFVIGELQALLVYTPKHCPAASSPHDGCFAGAAVCAAALAYSWYRYAMFAAEASDAISSVDNRLHG